jgi:hypothetical protein
MFLYHFGKNSLLRELCERLVSCASYSTLTHKLINNYNTHDDYKNVSSLTWKRRFHHLQMSICFGGFAMLFLTMKANNNTNDDDKC